ncbi:MAG: nucleotidyltransferase family protein [Acidobacteriota bacterium]
MRPGPAAGGEIAIPQSARVPPELCRLGRLLVGPAVAELAPGEATDLVPLAQRHGVAPMLAWQLERQGIAIHQPPWDALAAARRGAAARYLSLVAAHRVVASVFSAAQIPALWLKGYVLAHTVYPEPKLRPMVDLDALVPLDARDRARDALLAVGFKPSRWVIRGPFVELIYHYYLIGPPRTPVAFELHYRLSPEVARHLSPALEAWCWEHAESRQLAGLTVQTLKPEAQLAYLCAHAVLHHGRGRLFLRRFLDIHLLVAGSPHLQWGTVLDLAGELGWTRAVAEAVAICQSCFGTQIPDEKRVALDYLVFEGVDKAGQDPRLRPVGWVLRRVRQLAIQRWPYRVEFLAHLLVPPASAMRERYRERPRWPLLLCHLHRWLVVARDLTLALVELLGAPWRRFRKWMHGGA